MFYQITLASGKKVVADAPSAMEAMANVLQEFGSNDPQEEIIEVIRLEERLREIIRTEG